MSVSCSLLVDRAAQVQHIDDACRAKIKVIADKVDKRIFAHSSCSECINRNGNRLRYPDGVGKLHFNLISKAGSDDILRYIAGCISC
ncbi:Uncharacterised protein [Mycobacteroides abscessus subsp. abscessus]|nr:Uncharacterised protein [Mycobacteroides abscessus subsp. abscessus]